MNLYDVIIIGGGISGLYSAFNIVERYPKKKILVIERNDRLGGRMDSVNFYGTNVSIGAGVGRKKKDGLMISLLYKLGITYKEFDIKNDYVKIDIDLTNIIKILKKSYIEKKHHALTFKEYAINILGDYIYKKFVVASGFSDFEKEDVYEVLNHYGLDDNESGWTALKIPWHLLIDKLSKKIGLRNIITSCNVYSFNKEMNFYNIKTNIGDFSTKFVIIATTVDTVLKLLPKFEIYRQIHGQPFLKVYGKFSKPIPDLIMNTIVSGPLKKISPIDINNCIYMIAYTDNKDALSLENNLENTLNNRIFFEKMIIKALNLNVEKLDLIAIKSFFWKIGTHYYEPLNGPYKHRIEFINKAQHPMPGILVVGEMISRNQGWSLGALQSVEKNLNKAPFIN
jgi:hypothetical protein